LHRPLRVTRHGEHLFSVDGTPTDCVYLAIHGSFFPEKPSLIVSGINHGSNLGDDLLYSGTVAAAMEGALLGYKAMAMSYAHRFADLDEFLSLRPWIISLIRFLRNVALRRGSFFNVNFPQGTPKGIRFTRQGKRVYGNIVVEKEDPRRRKYYWIGGDAVDSEPIAGSDISAVEEGYISITPVSCDLTDFELFEEWRERTPLEFTL
jgi:5'-nucleotidase